MPTIASMSLGLTPAPTAPKVQLWQCDQVSESWAAVVSDPHRALNVDALNQQQAMRLKLASTGAGEQSLCLDLDTWVGLIPNVLGEAGRRVAMNHCGDDFYSQYWALSGGNDANAADGSGASDSSGTLRQYHSEHFCLDLPGHNPNALGTQAQLNRCDSNSERWRVSDGQIIAAWNTDLCLSAATSRRVNSRAGAAGRAVNSLAAGTSLRLVQCRNRHGHWLAEQASSTELAALRRLNVKPKALSAGYDSTLCLRVDELAPVDDGSVNDAGNGTQVVLGACVGSDGRGGRHGDTWLLANDGRLHLGADLSRCLDVRGENSSLNGAKVQLSGCEQVSERWYYGADNKLHARWHDGRCLDVSGVNSRQIGSAIQTGQCDQVSETWSGVSVGQLRQPSEYTLTDYRVLVNRDSGLCLTTVGADARLNRSKLTTATCDGSTAQLFAHGAERGWLHTKRLGDASLNHALMCVSYASAYTGAQLQVKACSEDRPWGLDGNYLYSLSAASLVMQPKASGMVELSPRQGRRSQRWVWREASAYQASKVYRTLRNRHMGWCLDVKNGGSTAGTPLWSGGCENSTSGNIAQQFSYDAVTGWLRSPLGSDMCVSHTEVSGSAQGSIALASCGSAHRWQSDDDGGFSSQAAAGKRLAFSGTAKAKTARLVNASSARTQRWLWAELGHQENYQVLVNQENRQCLDAQWGKSHNGTPLWGWSCDGSAAQGFYHEPATGFLRSQLNRNQCVATPDGWAVDGSAVKLWQCDQVLARWHIEHERVYSQQTPSLVIRLPVQGNQRGALAELDDYGDDDATQRWSLEDYQAPRYFRLSINVGGRDYCLSGTGLEMCEGSDQWNKDSMKLSYDAQTGLLRRKSGDYQCISHDAGAQSGNAIKVASCNTAVTWSQDSGQWISRSNPSLRLRVEVSHVSGFAPYKTLVLGTAWDANRVWGQTWY